MNRFFTKTFFRFFFSFVVIVGIAFGILYVASSWPFGFSSVDTMAHPR